MAGQSVGPGSAEDRSRSAAPARSGESVDLDDFDSLSDFEDDALFALSNSGYDPTRVAGGLRTAATRLATTLSLLELDGTARAHIASGKPSRIARTLLAIEDLSASQQRRMRLDPVRPSQVGTLSRSWSPADAGGVAVAAVLMLGVLVPVFSSVREKGQITACAGNMRSVGVGMAQYARDYNGFMPMASAGFGGSLGPSSSPVLSRLSPSGSDSSANGGPALAEVGVLRESSRASFSSNGDSTCWWNVGKKGQSNSANLFLLACEKYVPINAMACSGESPCLMRLCPSSTDYTCASEVAYSMQVQRPGGVLLEGPRRVVLSDRNPLTLRSMRGEMLDAMENSGNHRGRGQQILDNGGSVAWACQPKDPVSGDNIWIPADLESELVASGRRWLRPLKGDEQSRSTTDVLVGP